MNDEHAAKSAIETVTSAHITGCVSASISEDGEAAMVVFTVSGGDGPDKKFALTLPASQVEWFRGIGHSLVSQAQQKRKGPTGQVLTKSLNPKNEDEVSVGTTDQFPGQIAVIMNPGRPEEVIYMLPFATGLALAGLLEQAIMNKATPQQRDAINAAKRGSIILPPGRA